MSACLVGQNPTCFRPGIFVSMATVYDYSAAMHGTSTPCRSVYPLLNRRLTRPTGLGVKKRRSTFLPRNRSTASLYARAASSSDRPSHDGGRATQENRVSARCFAGYRIILGWKKKNETVKHTGRAVSCQDFTTKN